MDLDAFPTLTDAQRVQARQQAHRALGARVGREPVLSDFERTRHSRYGKAAGRIGTALAVTVLAAAFAISSVHVYTVGRQTYLETGGASLTASVIGIALVILAEASVLALSMLPTLWETGRRVTALMYMGMVASAFIAAVGNIDATILYTAGPFDWLTAWASSIATAPTRFILATLPPTITVLVGMGLKYWLLSSSRSRNEAVILYEQAYSDFQNTVSHIEDHADWRVTWGAALWDVWRRECGEYLAAVDDDLKLQIILREMSAEDRLRAALNSGAYSVNMRLNAGGFGASVGKPKKHLVLDYLKDHPEAAGVDQTELAAMLSGMLNMQISQSTVSRAVQQFSSNGYSHTDEDED